MNRFHAIVTTQINKYDTDTFNLQISPRITRITDKYLGRGKKASECTYDQVEVLSLIIDELEEEFK